MKDSKICNLLDFLINYDVAKPRLLLVPVFGFGSVQLPNFPELNDKLVVSDVGLASPLLGFAQNKRLFGYWEAAPIPVFTCVTLVLFVKNYRVTGFK